MILEFEYVQHEVFSIDVAALFLEVIQNEERKASQTLNSYLHEQNITAFKRENKLLFLDKEQYLQGEEVFVPLMFKVKFPGSKSFTVLSNCVGIEFCDISQGGDPIIACTPNWCEQNGYRVRPPLDSKFSDAGHLYSLSSDIFFTIEKARRPTPQLGDVGLSLEEVQRLRNISNFWPEKKKAISVRTVLKKWLESGQIPMMLNTPQDLLPHLRQVEIHSGFEMPLSESILRPPQFPITELKKRITEMMNGPFRNIDFRINFQKMSYSDFEGLYELLLAIQTETLDELVEKRISNVNTTSTATLKGTSLHEFSAQCDAVGRRTHQNAERFFPTDAEARTLFEFFCSRLSTPYLQTETQLVKEFMAIAHFFIKMANISESDPRLGMKKKKDVEVETENLWKTQPEMMLKSARYIAEMRATQILEEVDNKTARPENMFLEIAGTSLMSGNPWKGEPLGAMVNFRADALHLYRIDDHTDLFQPAVRMEDLKVSTKRQQKTKDVIKLEAQIRSKQLLRLLIYLFITSEHFVDGTLNTDKPTSSYVFHNNVTLNQSPSDLKTSLLYMNPNSGEHRYEDFTYSGLELQELEIIMSELIVPLLFMINSCPDLESFSDIFHGRVSGLP